MRDHRWGTRGSETVVLEAPFGSAIAIPVTDGAWSAIAQILDAGANAATARNQVELAQERYGFMAISFFLFLTCRTARDIGASRCDNATRAPRHRLIGSHVEKIA
jgi:hypothetical protein